MIFSKWCINFDFASLYPLSEEAKNIIKVENRRKKISKLLAL